jgi:hypothetical protein
MLEIVNAHSPGDQQKSEYSLSIEFPSIARRCLEICPGEESKIRRVRIYGGAGLVAHLVSVLTAWVEWSIKP